MEYIVEKRIEDFEFWGGAIQIAKMINEFDNADECWDVLEETVKNWGELPTKTEINDFIWFDALDWLRETELIPDEED